MNAKGGGRDRESERNRGNLGRNRAWQHKMPLWWKKSDLKGRKNRKAGVN